MSRAIDLSDQQFQKIVKHVEALQGTQKALTAQLAASNLSNTELAKEINNAGKAATEEVLRLRKMLKDHGIEIKD